MIAIIGNIDIVIGVNGYTSGVLEHTFHRYPTTVFAPFGNEDSRRSKFLDTVIVGIGDIDITPCINSDPARIRELAVPGAFGPPSQYEWEEIIMQ